MMNNETKMIPKEIYDAWRDQPILHDEDQWGGKYKTVGDMWAGEGYTVEQNPHALEEYDLQLLDQAKKLVVKVYEYHYGDSYMRKELGRLETIIAKLDELQGIGKAE